MIQLPDFQAVKLNFDLTVNDETPPLLLSVAAPQPQSGEVLFFKGSSYPITYADGIASAILTRDDLRTLGNGSHPFEVRLLMSNGHILTPATGRLSVYLQ